MYFIIEGAFLRVILEYEVRTNRLSKWHCLTSDLIVLNCDDLSFAKS